MHNFSDAIKLFFNKLKIPVSFVSAGWNKNDNFSQKAADEIAKLYKDNPEMIKSIEFSINPFHRFIANSIELAKAGKPSEARALRNSYVENTANMLKTFLPVFEGENQKGILLYKHAKDIPQNKGFGEKETAELYSEIYAKLKESAGSSIEHIKALKPEAVTAFNERHLIEPKGRGRQYFTVFDNAKKQCELIDEKVHWESLSKEDKINFAHNYTIKGIDINGKVYLTNISQTTIPTEIQLNYINKNKQTAPIYSDIKMDVLPKF